MSIKHSTPKGFSFSVAEAGIKKPGRKDLALLYSESDATVAAKFTTNKVKAAPVVLDMVRTRKGRARAILINSGNANACTGPRGMLDAKEMAYAVSEALKLSEESVLVSSTGVIGVPMPMQRIRPALKKLVEGLGASDIGDVAKAMMTTDRFPKVVSTTLKLGGKQVVITGVCKGAGMIEPNMATMLAYVMTDADIDKIALTSAFTDAVDASFNSLTVDGECSTNDTAILLANGAAENSQLRRGTEDFHKFSSALGEVCYEMARLIAADGEGATKLVEVEVTGARNPKQAKAAALAVARSLLVKTAVYGADPNWGRIMSAAGASGISMDEETTDIFIGRVKVFSGGLGTGHNAKAAEELKGKEVKITLAINKGQASARVLTCDLTEKYIKINAEYTT